MSTTKIPRSYSLPADIDQKLDDIATKTGTSRNKVLTRILEKYFKLPTLDAELDAELQSFISTQTESKPKVVETQTSFTPKKVVETTVTKPLLVQSDDFEAMLSEADDEDMEFDDEERPVVGVTEAPPMGHGKREVSVTGLFGRK